MYNAIKGAMAIGIIALGFSVSGCSSEKANAAAEKTPDPAELTAAAIDQAAAKAPAAPEEKAPAK